MTRIPTSRSGVTLCSVRVRTFYSSVSDPVVFYVLLGGQTSSSVTPVFLFRVLVVVVDGRVKREVR